MVKFQSQLGLLVEGIKGAGCGRHSVPQGTAEEQWQQQWCDLVHLIHLGQLVLSLRMALSPSAPLLPLGPVSCLVFGAMC